MTRTPLTVLVAAVGALTVQGCDLSSSDRAGGGKPAARATTLTMANVNYAPEELRPFASAVERVSGGRLRIRFANEWGRAKGRLSADERIEGRAPGYGEANLIRDVQAGKADLGWAGSRAFDVVGDPAFRPLHAPMLIDSYALELEVLTGDLVEPMLKSLEGLGLRGVGVLPGPLRRPLAKHALLAPGDWSGALLGFSGGEQTARSLRALGARPRLVPSGGSIAGLDGIEQHVAAIARNGYQREAPHLTGNVVLWPRPLVVFAGSGVTPAQLQTLRHAARESIPAVLDAVRRDEVENLEVACRRGMQIATATPAAVSALREGFRPIYADLERDESARHAIAEIERVGLDLGDPPDTAACEPSAARTNAAGIPDGTYEVTVTPRDALRAGLAPGDPYVRAGVSHFTLELQGGDFLLESDTDPDGWEGTYSIYRDRVTVTGIDGDSFTARWSFEDGRLRFEGINDPVREGVPGSGYYAVTWGSHPWDRVR
jgi:TRAP-type C4-dicarboxylate transport system substrate-binding protein